MRQQGDIVFQQFFKRTRIGGWTQKDVNLLNSKIAKELPTINDLFLVVIVQSNTKKQPVNYHQIYKSAKEKSQDVYIFPTSYIRSKNKNENLVRIEKLF